MASFEDKVFVLMGGASGIGLATAKTLLSRGASVGLSDFNSQTLSNVAAEFEKLYPGKAYSKQVNVTSREDCRSFLKETKERFGKLHGAANFAGIAGRHLGRQAIWDIASEEFDAINSINFGGAFNVLSESLQPGLMEEPGSVVHVGSMFSQRGFEGGAAYSGSKHAGVGLVKSAAMDAGKRGIRVNCVLPGPIDTPMHRANIDANEGFDAPTVPLGRDGYPEEVACVVVFLLGEEGNYVTGACWNVDGGANA